MGLDMYLLSIPKPDFEVNGELVYEMLLVKDLEKTSPKYTFKSLYGRNQKEIPAHYWNFFYNITKDKQSDSIFRSIFTEEAYWRKAYQIADELQPYYNNVNDALSRPLTKDNIIKLRDFAKSIVDEVEEPKKVKIIGYVTQTGIEKMFPLGAKELIVEPMFYDESVKMPIKSYFYSSLPLEYLCEGDWELSHAIYTVEQCNKILENFDFDHRILYYYASY